MYSSDMDKNVHPAVSCKSCKESIDVLESVRTRLRKATHPDHVRLNRNPILSHLTQPDLSMSLYIRIVEAYAHFYQRVEMRIAQSLPTLNAPFPYESRLKTAWLITDLQRLDHILPPSPPLPEAQWDIGPITSIGELAGILYALEGSTLGGQVISRHLLQSLGLTADSGARFFNGYGSDTESRWQEFCLWLDTLHAQTDQVAQAQTSARKLFCHLEALLNAYA